MVFISPPSAQCSRPFPSVLSKRSARCLSGVLSAAAGAILLRRSLLYGYKSGRQRLHLLYRQDRQQTVFHMYRLSHHSFLIGVQNPLKNCNPVFIRGSRQQNQKLRSAEARKGVARAQVGLNNILQL